MKFEMKRKIDELGRIVLPIDLRNYYGIKSGDKVVLLPVREGIQLAKAEYFIMNQISEDMAVNVDELGRIVIPKEMRKKMDIANSDPVEIYVEGDKIILTKYHPSCSFCGSEEGVVEFKNKKICHSCLNEIKHGI